MERYNISLTGEEWSQLLALITLGREKMEQVDPTSRTASSAQGLVNKIFSQIHRQRFSNRNGGKRPLLNPRLVPGVRIWRELDRDFRPVPVESKPADTNPSGGSNKYVVRACYSRVLSGEWAVGPTDDFGVVIFLDNPLRDDSGWTWLTVTGVAKNGKTAWAEIEYGNWDELGVHYMEARAEFEEKLERLSEKFGG